MLWIWATLLYAITVTVLGEVLRRTRRRARRVEGRLEEVDQHLREGVEDVRSQLGHEVRRRRKYKHRTLASEQILLQLWEELGLGTSRRGYLGEDSSDSEDEQDRLHRSTRELPI